MSEENYQKDIDYWSFDGTRTVYGRRDALNYARMHDASLFFEMLEESIGEGYSLEDIIDEYARQNDREIQEFVDYA